MSNCTSNILIHTRAADGGRASCWDCRILLPGIVDELAYEMGSIGQGMNFEEFNKLSWLDGAALKHVPLDQYSDKIREAYPVFDSRSTNDSFVTQPRLCNITNPGTSGS